MIGREDYSMRSRYDLAKDSGERASDGTFYPDVCTIPTHKFRFTSGQQAYFVNQIEIKRLDILAFNLYQVTEFDDILLWLNRIEDPSDMSAGDQLLIATKTDVEAFYYEHRV